MVKLGWAGEPRRGSSQPETTGPASITLPPLVHDVDDPFPVMALTLVDDGPPAQQQLAVPPPVLEIRLDALRLPSL